jgi:hypothetical protein
VIDRLVLTPSRLSGKANTFATHPLSFWPGMFDDTKPERSAMLVSPRRPWPTSRVPGINRFRQLSFGDSYEEGSYQGSDADILRRWPIRDHPRCATSPHFEPGNLPC